MAAAGSAKPWEGGEVLMCGGTDWNLIGRGGGSKKSDKEKQAEAERAELYPNLISPHRIKGLTGIKIMFIASGSAACHSIAGDAAGRLFTWGRNEKGQLGLGDLAARNVPTLVTALAGKRIIQGAAGKFHTAVVTDDGASYTWGSNLQGQLGTGSLKSKDKNEELQKSPVSALVENCSFVACGLDFTMWLCEGALFSCGCPQYGQLGHNTDHEYNAKDSSVKIMYEPQPRPALIEALTHTKVTKVACGHNHTLALDDKGAAYSWGNGGYGRLGHSVQKDEFKPRQIETFTGRCVVHPTSFAACGSTSSFALGPGEQLFAWGRLKTSGDNTMYPKPMSDLSGWHIRSFACGNVTFAVAADDSTITWGQAQYGELGYGPNGKKSSANPDKCHAVDGVHTHQVACGVGHTLFLSDPTAEKVKNLPLWEPVVDAEPEVEPAGDAGKGKGKAAAGKGSKRKADDKPAPKGRAKK